MDARERGRIVAGRVARRIAELVPEGLGQWGPAWDLVADPSDAFLDALARWEIEDTPDTRGALQAAADGLVRAWVEAARQYREVGSPGGVEVPV